MNRDLMDYLERRMRDNRSMDSRRSRSDMRDSRRDSRRDYRDMEDSRDMRDYEDSRRERDYRGDEGGRMYRVFADHRDREDGEDYKHFPVRLSKTDIRNWKSVMENVDGTQGTHYDMQQIMSVADKVGVTFEDYSEKEFCMAVNMMYSDYGHVIKKHCPDKELSMCAELAKAFLEDPDGPEPSEKLALYFHCIVNA